MKTNKLTFYQFLLKIKDKRFKKYISQLYAHKRDYWSVKTPDGWVYGLYSKEQCGDVLKQFN